MANLLTPASWFSQTCSNVFCFNFLFTCAVEWKWAPWKLSALLFVIIHTREGRSPFFSTREVIVYFFLDALVEDPASKRLWRRFIFQIAQAIYRLVHNLGCSAHVLFQKRGIEWRPVAPINECMAEFLKKLWSSIKSSLLHILGIIQGSNRNVSCLPREECAKQ